MGSGVYYKILNTHRPDPPSAQQWPDRSASESHEPPTWVVVVVELVVVSVDVFVCLGLGSCWLAHVDALLEPAAP